MTEAGHVAGYVRRGLLGLAVTAAAGVTAIAVSGGGTLSLGIVTIRVHNPLRLALIAAASGIAYIVADRRRLPEHWPRLRLAADRWAATIAMALSFAAVGLGLRFGTFSAGSADAYGYISQADRWLSGTLVVAEPLAALPIADAAMVFAPLGYRPATIPGHTVPTYAPGLPLLMALAKALAGASAVYYVVPLFGGALIWATFRLGAAMASPRVGLAAGALLLTSPSFLLQVTLPMSDVPVAAVWTLVLVVALRDTPASSLVAGLLSAMAVAIRPNLLPLAVALAVWIPVTVTRGESRSHRVLLYLAGLAPGVWGIAWLNWRLYGAPWRLGYGALSTLYSWAYIGPNLARYVTWLWQTQGWASLAWLGICAPLRFPIAGRLRSLGTMLIVVLWASYVPYLVFDEWWYLRFLLPAMPAMIVFTILVWRRVFGQLLGAAFGPAAAIGCVLLTLFLQYDVARTSAIWAGRAAESRYARAAAVLRAMKPTNPVCLSMQHSGGLRYYGGCPTARYDWLPEGSLCRSLETLRAAGLHPYIVLDDWEQPAFQRRFALPTLMERWPWPTIWRHTDVTILDAGQLPAPCANGVNPAIPVSSAAPVSPAVT